jgi:hypothetical protein
LGSHEKLTWQIMGMPLYTRRISYKNYQKYFLEPLGYPLSICFIWWNHLHLAQNEKWKSPNYGIWMCIIITRSLIWSKINRLVASRGVPGVIPSKLQQRQNNLYLWSRKWRNVDSRNCWWRIWVLSFFNFIWAHLRR